MDSKHIRPVILTLLAMLPALAVAVDVAPSAPERYTVQRGDTLWDIAGRFLRQPWRWPEIWQRNPQVRDADLIYPGDVLTLEYVQGRPVVRRERGRRGGTVKLSPSVREVPQERAIPTIPIDAIGPFISESRVLESDELEAAAYVVSAGREHLVGSTGDVVYARGLPADPAQRYGIYRSGGPYYSPESGEVLGYQATFVADVALDQIGDPATLYVLRADREIQPGDRLLPLEDDILREPFLPRAPEADLRGSIISVLDGVTQVGRYHAVVIDLGAADGLQPGHVLTVFQRGALVDDPDPKARHFPEPAPRQDFPMSFDTDLDILMSRVANAYAPAFLGPPQVQLPDRSAGVVMVLRPFERVSYALVMEATRAMHVEDVVATP
jgi:hypothetical protein